MNTNGRNGRKQDVLIEDEFYTDPRTGVEMMMQTCFTVWADESMKSVIAGVEGVTMVSNPLSKTMFHVWFDKRYDREFLKREIEAAILCQGD